MSLAGAVLDVLFPPRCAACSALLPADAPGGTLVLCARCERHLNGIAAPCPRCGLPDRSARLCDACAAAPPAFDSAHALWLYGGPVAEVLHRYKYEDRPEFAQALGARLAALDLPEADLVVPVPLHAARRRARTYDQALYLAQALARGRGLPCDRLLLERRRSTARQVGQDRSERSRNVEGAFAVRRPATGLRLLLVDDVVTTGATAAECAATLKQAGAREVHVVSVARAVRQSA